MATIMESITLFHERFKDVPVLHKLTDTSTLLALCTIAGAFFASKFLLALLRRHAAARPYLYSFFESLYRPLPRLILIYGLLSIFLNAMQGAIAPKHSSQILMLFLIGAGTYLIFRWKGRLEEVSVKHATKENRALHQAMHKIGSIFIFIISGLMALEVVGIPLSALLTIGGVGGLAASWAAKDFVANLFGGLMIYVARPFLEGDYISSPNKKFEGTVTDIGWYITTLQTADKRPLYVPNSLVTGAIIENFGTNKPV